MPRKSYRSCAMSGLTSLPAPHAPRSVQFLNTVIGKMSGVVTAPEQIKAEGLACLVEGSPRALLVEEFNRILITQIRLPGFQAGHRGVHREARPASRLRRPSFTATTRSMP